MGVKVNPPPQLRIPPEFLGRPITQEYFRQIGVILFQLFNRSGGTEDINDVLLELIKANEIAIAINADNIEANADNIAINTDAIALNAANIIINAGNIAENTGNITINADAIEANSINIDDLYHLQAAD